MRSSPWCVWLGVGGVLCLCSAAWGSGSLHAMLLHLLQWWMAAGWRSMHALGH